MSVNYNNLPGILPKLIIQHVFKQKVSEEWLVAMTKEQTYYSKSKGGTDKGFKSDNAQKLKKSTEEIRVSSFCLFFFFSFSLFSFPIGCFRRNLAGSDR